ncbi:hypothetical protein J5J10_04810 [Ciceribacter sp. L1K23]|uniref:hypothetical protein n=1 Tax=Ciceribacter sp. L1K23 TaxID=2820276 RepID=UPI001B82FB78|nr:hypothetical protein [Ciceribacter sp. L1K23]MBR0554995.1 hypothetical protein [Ciceribacter sp. L1K23]
MEIIVLLVIAGCVYWLYKNRAPANRNDWVRKFSVYYATNALCLHGSSSGDVPEQLVGLMEPRIAGGVQQSFIASLGNYLQAECGRNLQPSDYPKAVADIRKLLSANIQWANSHAALGPFIRAMHKEEAGTDITEAELAAHRNEIIRQVKTDEQAAAMMMGQILRFNMEAMFKEMFGVRYYDYLQAKYPKVEPSSPKAAAQA